MRFAPAGFLALVVVAALTAGAAAAPNAGSAPGVYAFDASSGKLTRLLKGGHERIDVGWSPDGKWITSTPRDDYLVDVIPAAGGRVRDVDSVSWSPNGSRVAYTSKGALFAAPASWRAPRLVARCCDNDVGDWSPDGSRFAFGPAPHCCWTSVRVARADGSGARTLWKVPATGGHDSWVDDSTWSPTGTQLAVDATVNNAVGKAGGGEFLYVIDTVRDRAKKVYDGDASFQDWSPDGKWLVLRTDDQVYLLSPKGGQPRAVCVGPCPDPLFSPDGHRFVFFTDADPGPASTIWLGDIDGSPARRLVDLPARSRVVWSPDGKTLGLTVPEPDQLHATAWAVDVATGAMRQLTDNTQREVLVELSSDGALAVLYRATPPSVWVVRTAGGEAPVQVMSLATGKLGPCPQVAWSPVAPTLAIANAACEPS